MEKQLTEHITLHIEDNNGWEKPVAPDEMRVGYHKDTNEILFRFPNQEEFGIDWDSWREIVMGLFFQKYRGKPK